ncbi:MAG: phosphatidylglycerophosphatase A [Thermodesulfobacteriota bacterium]
MTSGGGLGYAPVAPGTFGTLAGVPFYLAFSLLPAWAYAAATIALIAAAAVLAGRAEEIHGGRDDRRIVIDEAAGYVVTMTGLRPSLLGMILGFLLFRAFDILKPWPGGTIDRRLRGGWGVVLDDVAAGLYGLVVLQIIARLWPAVARTCW